MSETELMDGEEREQAVKLADAILLAVRSHLATEPQISSFAVVTAHLYALTHAIACGADTEHRKDLLQFAERLLPEMTKEAIAHIDATMPLPR